MAKILCMEVGTSTVRLAEVAKRGKTVEITKIFVFDTPDDATKDGKVRVSDSVVSAIRDGIDESGIAATDVYFVVESTKILFKQIVDMPFVPKNKVQGMLELSFTDHFPVDETLYHLAHRVEKVYEKNGQKMMALDVFAIPNDLSESYYNLSVALGLNARGLTDTSRSMVSLFPNSFKNRNVAMVNINENLSTLTIVTDGDMIFNKTIPYGVCSTLRHVINSPLTMDDTNFTDAAGHLYSQNILLRQMPVGIVDSNNEEEKLRYNTTASIVSLVKSIEATFAAFLAKENIQIQEFQLSGLGAGFAGISQLLTSEFGIPVTIVQQEGRLRVNASAADETLLLSCYPCVGASIDEINFFTKDEQAGGEIAYNRKIDKTFMFCGILICLAAFGYSAYSWLQASLAYQDAHDENVRLTKRVQELRDLGVEVAYNRYTTALSYNEEVKNLYDETRSGNEEMTVFLEELEHLLPMSARVTSMTLNPSLASVSFICDDKFVAAGVLHLLRNMQTTNNMECSGVAEIKNTGEITFVCKFSLKNTADRLAEEEANNANQEENVESPEDIIDEEPTEPVEDNVEDTLLAETTGVNTNENISLFTIGDVLVDIKTLAPDVLDASGFTPSGAVFMTYNDAISITGLTYANENGDTIEVADGDNASISAVGVDSDIFVFHNDIRVGMTIDEALAAIANENVAVTNGYIVLKSNENTLILKADFDGLVVENIYLVNNAVMFPTVEPEAPDVNIETPEIEDDIHDDAPVGEGDVIIDDEMEGEE